MKKKMFLIVGIVLLLGFSFLIYKEVNKKKKEDNIKLQTDIVEEYNQDLIDKKNENDDKKINQEDDKNQENDNSKVTKKETTKKETSEKDSTASKPKVNKNGSKENPQDATEKNPPVVQNKEEDSHVEDNKEETKEWEKLGISEDDYYNKPMWKWARIDYPTHEECIQAGEKMGYEIISYTYININSYSGKYLGDMLKVKYPN